MGDVLIADQDSPTLLTHWTRVNKNISFGTSAGTACEGDDSRLSDARTPASHAASHVGADAIQNATAAQVGLALMPWYMGWLHYGFWTFLLLLLRHPHNQAARVPPSTPLAGSSFCS